MFIQISAIGQGNLSASYKICAYYKTAHTMCTVKHKEIYEFLVAIYFNCLQIYLVNI